MSNAERDARVQELYSRPRAQWTDEERMEYWTIMLDDDPHVGIFWLLPNGYVLVADAPLAEAQRYGQFFVYEPSHIDTWTRLQREGIAPADVEYDEFPRGRAHYDTVAETWTVLGDRHILENADAMQQVRERLSLHGDIVTGLDLHYRCPRCLYGEDRDDDEL